MDARLDRNLCETGEVTMRKLFMLVACAFMLLGAASAIPDGAHDFDFDFGSWHTHIRRLLHPLTGSTTWATYDGTVTVRKVWDGAANVEEVEANGPNHLEFVNVRLYNKASHQWSLNGASSTDGTLGTAMFGGFEGGRGVFYDQETFNGRTILDRQTFFKITPTSYAFEQAFSDDGGKTWEPNFVAHLTRTSVTAPSEGSQTVADASHDFDFNYGTWSTHITSYEETGHEADAPTAYVGTVAVRKIWHGRAFMEEIKASNASGGFQGLSLFLYNPQARQWSQTFASRGAGAFDPSMVGRFKGGRGELVSFPVADRGALIFARDVWSDIHSNTHHFEVQYSRDGGRTWQPSFVANLERIGPGL
jgi:BNR/Asp-box repeat